MNAGRCQICGRRARPRNDGTLARHYVKGAPCAGEGELPIERDDRALESAAAAAELTWRGARDELAELRRRRANYIPPELERLERETFPLMLRLGRRLQRHRDWPARYRRQMELQGWADVPPAYLLDREALQA